MLGGLRLGPDLANLGARETGQASLLLKLYNPRISTPTSKMPPYAHLFDQRKLGPTELPGPDALRLPEGFAPPPGFEVVPRPEALALAAYLSSLRSDAIFYEVFPPLPPPEPAQAERYWHAYDDADVYGRCVRLGANDATEPVLHYHWGIYGPEKLAVQEFWDTEVWTTDRYRNALQHDGRPPEF